jgi:hypothetical protein
MAVGSHPTSPKLAKSQEVLAMFAEGGRKNRVVPEERIFHIPL